jgi:hypothetical protein
MTNRRTIIKVQRRGGVDNDVIIEQHAHQVIADMFSTRLANTLRITIKLRAGLSKDKLGDCAFRDSSKSKTARSKHHIIRLQRDISLAQQLRTLTHELKHVEQMSTGRLTARVTYKVPGYFWRPPGHRGAAQKFDSPNGECVVPWAQRPWEIEARDAEKRYENLIRENSG